MESTYVSSHRLHHARDGGRGVERRRGVTGRSTSTGARYESSDDIHDTEHALLAMAWSVAEVEGGIGGVNNLGDCERFALSVLSTAEYRTILTDEVLVVLAGGEESITRLVARQELRALGDGVVVGTPHELDGVTDGRIQGEGNVTQDALSRGDDDGVGGASADGALATAGGGRGSVLSRWGTEGSNAFCCKKIHDQTST